MKKDSIQTRKRKPKSNNSRAGFSQCPQLQVLSQQQQCLAPLASNMPIPLHMDSSLPLKLTSSNHY